MQTSYDILPIRFSALAASCCGVCYAATFGQGVFQYSPMHSWQKLSGGLPEGATTYRLGWMGPALFAATSRGLFLLDDDGWQPAGIAIPCYQAAVWGDSFAMTEDGLWRRHGGAWEPLAYPGKSVFDLLATPNFLFLGCSDGIAFYDLLMADWCSIPLNRSVTSLAAVRQYLVGTTTAGTFLFGNKRGGFADISFEDMHAYKLVSDRQDVYACTSKGIFRLDFSSGRLMLQSMGIRFSVTDAVVVGQRLVVTTLHYGIWYLALNGRAQEADWTIL